MPPVFRTPSSIAQQFKDLAPYVGKVRDWAPVVLFDTNDLAAAAIPSTQFFNAVKANAVTNLEIQNRVNYFTIVLGIGISIFSPNAATAIADAIIVRDECEIEFEKDGSIWPSIPVCSIPSGGGLNLAIGGGAAAIQWVTNGLGNTVFQLRQPIAISPKQAFSVWLRSSGATALTAAVGVRIKLEGIEARRPI